MRPSLLKALVPRSVAQWMAVLGLVPFGIGAWMQARDQREINIATMAVEQSLEQLERRVDELAERSRGAGVRVEVTDGVTADSSAGSATVPRRDTQLGYDSLADGVRSLRAENATLAREFERLTRLHEDLRARRGALRGVSAPANILLMAGALITVAGVLTDIRQFRQQRRRAA